jgi:2-dehydropantoate 2-reductase
MRFVVYGAGAIGGVVGGRLCVRGCDVVLIARGAHFEAIAARGLRIESPEGETTVRVPVVDHPSRLTFTPEDVVVLAMKTQDTGAALTTLAGLTPATTPIACAQNGVDGERQAIRVFRNVYGVSVICPCAYLEPGVVQAYGTPCAGVLDVGRYPDGIDDTTGSIVAAFGRAGFDSQAQSSIRRFKYGKLLFNLGNAVEAVCGPAARKGPLVDLVRREAILVYRAAEIDYDPQAHERGGVTPAPIGDRERPGGSSWQSLQRRLGSIETDYLNGEIVMLGRLCRVATPANEVLQWYANDLARQRRLPGSVSEDEVLAAIEARGRG